MKNIHLHYIVMTVLISSFLLISCNNKEYRNTVEIEVNNKQDTIVGTLFLYSLDNNTIDSIEINNNGSYEINLPEEKPRVYTAFYKSDNNRGVVNFIATENIQPKINLQFIDNELKLSSKNVTYSDKNKMIEDFQEYQSTMETFSDRDKEMQKKWSTLLSEYNGDGSSIPAELRKPIDDESIAIMNDKKTYLDNYVKNNNDIVSLFIYNTNLRFSYGYDQLNEILNSTPESLKNTVLYENLNQKRETLKTTRIGAIAPEIIKPTPEGDNLALSSLRGKYVLLDFWASWCSPCRKENPWVKKAYEKYHNNGFDVYAVSFDYPGDKEKWLKAIKDDKLTWNHVSSLKGWNDPVAKEYNISGIPAPFLLDPEGKIIAKGDQLREEGLIKTLEKYLTK